MLKDVQAINDSGRGRKMTTLQFLLAMMRNFRWEQAPAGLRFKDLFKAVDGHLGRKMGVAEKFRYEWRIIMVAGMWFQDLFNYDFRRTEMCIIPYGTQVGEVSFCAYNTGVGWRNIVEELFQTAKTVDWFKTKGRHPIYAGGRSVALPSVNGQAAAAAGEAQVQTPAVPMAAAGGNGHGREEAAPQSPANGNGNGNGNGHAPAAKGKVSITRLPKLDEHVNA